MVENIKKVSERATVTETQKIYMLGSSCINPQEGAWCVNRMIDLSDPADTQKKNTSKDCDGGDHNNNDDNNFNL